MSTHAMVRTELAAGSFQATRVAHSTSWTGSIPVILVVAACCIEQFRGVTGIVTGQIPLFTSLQDSLGVSGLVATPFEIVLGVFLAVLVATDAKLAIPWSALTKGFAAFLLIAVVAELHGLLRGGNLTFALWEFRPWLYLVAGYALGAAFTRDQRTTTGLLWAIVLGTGLKGLQGLWNVIQTHDNVRPESILAHEEAFFFGVYMVLVAALWLWGIRGRLRTLATLLLPAVLVSDMANYRRSAWVILGAGLILLVVVTWVRFPERRRLVAQICLAGAVVSAIYLSVYWDATGSIAQPARALRSAIDPTQRDYLSNLYRTTEDATLWINIKASLPLGAGFGTPINYVLPIVDLSSTDPLIKYVPHDGLLWVWFRLGLPGVFVLWFVLSMALVTASRTIRKLSGLDALAVLVGAAAIVGYAIEAQYDYGFFWFRIAVFVGVWIGVIGALGKRTRDEASGPRVPGGVR